MEKPFATLPVLFTFQLITSGFITHGAGLDVDTPLLNQDVVVPYGYTPFPDIGVAYKPFYQPLKFESARKHCIAEGGNLAVIDSSIKVEYAKSLAPLDEPKYFFVGIHKYFDNSEWVSLKTGLPLADVSWQPSYEHESARCVGLMTSEDGLELFSCDRESSHICEIPINSRRSEIPNETSVGGLPLRFVPWKGGSILNDGTKSCASLWNTGVTPSSCSAHGSHMCEIPLSKTPQITHNVTGPGVPQGSHSHSPKSATELPSGYTVYTHLGVAYKFYNYAMEWNEAREYCASHGANLAVIDSYEKVQHVIELRGADTTNVGVGVHRLFDDAEWIDVRNGSPAIAIPWRSDNTVNDASRQCMVLTTYDGDRGLYAGSCTLSQKIRL